MCRTRHDDTGMVRVGRAADGSWYVGRGVGRGAWVCASAACWGSLRAGHVARALRAPVSAEDAERVAALGGHALGAVGVKE